MRHLTFKEKDSYRVCLLVNSIHSEEIRKEYLKYLSNPDDVLILDLYKNPRKKKTPTAEIKEYLVEVEEVLHDLGVEYVVVCNSDYYKVFAKEPKADVNIGYIKSHNGYKIAYAPDFKAIFYDPEKIRGKIQRSMEAVENSIQGSYEDPGNIDFFGTYPRNVKAISEELTTLLGIQQLTCDIETFSLKPHKAGLASIGFATSTSMGISFQIDTEPGKENKEVRKLLRKFFEDYQGKLIFHNIGFDATVLIYQLWMKDITDTEGLLTGMKHLLKNFEDTKLIAYLATNTCAGNELGLKALSQEFAGNYAQDDIGDVTKIPLDQLLEYNLVDCLATWFVYNKYKPKLIQDNQKEIYESLFIPAMRDIIQMQLTGFPINMERVLEVEKQLQGELDDSLKVMNESDLVKDFVYVLKKKWVEKRNKELKTKRVTIDDAKETFNPRSHKQLQELFFDTLKLPVLNTTKSGCPSTDADTFKSLVNHTDSEEVKALLQALIDFSAVDKILTAFIPAFKQAVYSPWTQWHYLIGNFNLGGTVSGRLSSSEPNLQNLPATGSKYAKVIKSCFQPPEGWLLCGLDFNALEDHISALLTKDKNKLKVYTDHFDGHCLRAYSYFADKMPDITKELEEHPENEVEIINSIKDRYKSLRQKSKGPTFCLTYNGTNKALMDIFGFSKEEALSIESKYHELYKESDEWVQRTMNQAAKDGYVTVAFGLRVRTPIMHQCILGLRNTPKEAEAEKRTAANACGQSYCLLNNRAGVQFNNEVRNSDYRLDIRPVAHIHDAQYFLVRDQEEVILWANEHLVKAVSWQDDPAIAHPIVKLGGEFSIFYPNWSSELALPNDLNKEKLTELSLEFVRSLKGK